MTAKSTAARVAELRARRKDSGLVRLELWARPETHELIKLFAAKLQRKQEKKL
jgi:hypothetical protein